MRSFIFQGNWFDRKYRDKSSGRYPTFKIAFNLLVQRKPSKPFIVETGTTRMKNDWGAGMSTLLFAEIAKMCNGQVITVDISRKNLDVCKEIIDENSLGFFVRYEEKDSVEFLKQMPAMPPIDLLYLDSLDYPLTLEEGNPIVCQEHQLAEYLAARNKLVRGGIILLDDNEIGDGGKSKLTKDKLLKDGCELIYEGQQSLWQKV